MPSIKCMSCGNRILLPTDQETCANCGALLTQQFMAAQQAAAVEQMLNPFASGTAEPSPVSPTSETGSLRLAAPDGQQTSSNESTDKMRALQLYPDPNQAPPPMAQEQRGVQVYQQPGVTPYWPQPGNYGVQPYQPYQSTQIVPFDPRGTLVPFTGDDAPGVPELTPLPKGFPHRPPDIVGTVIHTQTQMENPIMPDSVTFVLKTLMDLIWTVPHENASRDRTVQVTTIRVRLSNGTIRDARVEGYMRGVNVSLGDTVSLWGIKRRGMLLLYKGYNHSAKGSIKTTASATGLTMVLLLIIIVGLGYLLFNWLHGHLPFLGH